MKLAWRQPVAGSVSLFVASVAHAGGVPGVALEEVVVTAQRTSLVGTVSSASQGTVTQLQLETRLGTIREDGVEQTSFSVFVEQEIRLAEHVCVTGGLRHDRFDFEVDSLLGANSGKASDSITSPSESAVVAALIRRCSRCARSTSTPRRRR